MATYFAPADNLGALSQYSLQDQQQNLAAAADRRRDMTEMMRVNSAREAAQREQMSRMYDTNVRQQLGMGDIALRGDLGRSDQALRRELGMGDIALRGELGRGDIALRGELGRGQLEAGKSALAQQERLAGLPYEKMTAYQAAEIQRQKDQLQLMRDNPNLYMQLYGDPRMKDRMYQTGQSQAEAKRAADVANSRLAQLGGISQLQREMVDDMDKYGGWGVLPFNGMLKPDAQVQAARMLNSLPVDEKFATWGATQAGMDRMRKRLADAIGPDLAPYASQLMWDPNKEGFRASFESPYPLNPNKLVPLPGSPTTRTNTPPSSVIGNPATNATLNQPLAAVAGQGITNFGNSVPDYIWSLTQGLIPTNAPAGP